MKSFYLMKTLINEIDSHIHSSWTKCIKYYHSDSNYIISKVTNAEYTVGKKRIPRPESNRISNALLGGK